MANSRKFGPTPRPHQHSDPIINTQTNQAKKLHTCALLSCRLMAKTHFRPQKQRFGYPRLSIKFHTHRLKPRPVSKRSTYPLKTISMLFHVHLKVTEFWPQIYSLSPAQSNHQTSQIRPNMKMGGACHAERSTLYSTLAREGAIGCCSLSRLFFGHISSSTNITAHST